MHSGGHNELIRSMEGEYYFCVSQDMYYPDSFVYDVIKELEKTKNKNYGSATIKILQGYFEDTLQRTKRIDSCGIDKTFYYKFYDTGQGETDHGQYDHKKSIFGSSGALAIYRKSALEKISYKEKDKIQYFNEKLHYKNDVDMSIRLQEKNQKCLFLPFIQVYHDRKLSSHITRKSKSLFEKQSSYFGNMHIFQILKFLPLPFYKRIPMYIYYMLIICFTYLFEREVLRNV
jgi:GT2 family glycosyltransferase